MAIKKDYLIAKRNILNEVRANCMTEQEIRFFTIYLAKINSKDVSTRLVRFSVDDFQRILELGKAKISHLKTVAYSLLSKCVSIPTENGGLTAFQLFRKVTIDKDDNGDWYVEIDAHDDALPLMFEFKRDFFTYKLWNALRLRSANQIRFYEILKQYEGLGERTLSIEELRELIGIAKDEYTQYRYFKRDVIDVSQKALKEYTDLAFDYEPIKKGRGGKVSKIKFRIEKNENYTGQITLAEFIEQQPEGGIIEEEPLKNRLEERIDLLSTACDGLYTMREDLLVLHDMTMKMGLFDDLEATNYVASKYHEMLSFIGKGGDVKNRQAYFKGMIKKDLPK
jgi:plasmid replication initiation protein